MVNVNARFDGEDEKRLLEAKKKSGRLTWPEFILVSAGVRTREEIENGYDNYKKERQK
jgi:hypothetical protein